MENEQNSKNSRNVSESEKRYRMLFESASDAIFTMEKDRFIECNKMTLKMFGCKLKDIIGHNPWEFSPEKQPDGRSSKKKAKDLIEAAYKGNVQRFYWKHAKLDKTPFDAEVSLNLMTIGDKKFLQAIVRDITERKQAEDSLLRLTSILENTSDLVGTATSDTKLMYMNSAGRKLIGWKKNEDISKRKIQDVHPKWAWDIIQNEGISVAIERGIWRGETAVLHKNGSELPVSQVIMSHKSSSGEVEYFSTIMRDISKEKETQEELKKSEIWYRSLIENSASVYSVVDEKGKAIYQSRSIERVYGWSPEEVKDKPIFERIHPDDLENVKKGFQGLFEKPGKIMIQEVRYKHKDDNWLTIEALGANHLDNPAIKGITITSHDISERKEAESALKESEEKFRNVFQSTPMGIHMYQLDPEGRLIFIGSNPAADRILGVDNQQFIGKTIEEAFPPLRETVVPKKYSLAAEKGKDWHTEQIDYEDEKIKGAFEVHAFQTSPNKMVSLFRDITNRKQTEAKLKESEERFRSLVETAPIVILHLSPEGNIIEFNPEAERLYGRKRDEVLGKDYLEEFIPKKIRKTVSADIKKVLEGKPTRGFENPIISPEGIERSLVWNVDRMLDSEGKPTGIIAVGQDITERKDAEEALRLSEEKFSKTFHSSPNLMALFDLKNNRIMEVNDRTMDITGYDKEEIIGKEITEPGFLIDREENKRLIDLLKDASSVKDVEIQIRKKTGEDRFLSVSGETIEVGGDKFAIITGVDITERKIAEEKLKESEETLRALINAPTETAILVDIEGRIQAINDIAAQRLGKRPEDIIGSGMYDYLPPDLVKSRKAYGDEVIRSGQPVRFQDQRAGRFYDNNVYPVFDSEKNVKSIAVYARDITENIHAEEALKESEEKFRSAFDLATIGRAMADPRGTFIDINTSFCNVIGYEKEELLRKTWMEITHPEDLKESQELSRQMIEQGKSSFRFIHRLIHKNGNIIWVDLNVVLIRDESGNPLYVVGDIVDITEQKKAEESLQESEKKFRAIFDQSAQLLTILSPEGKILEVNEKLTQLPGYKESLIGKPYWNEDFWPDSPELWDIIHDHVNKASNGKFASFEAEEVHDDILHVTENIIFPVKDDKGEIMFLVAGALDITERKKAEEKLRNSEDRYRTISGLISDFVYSIKVESDGTQVPEWSTETLKRIVGMDYDELLKQGGWKEIIHPDDLPIVVQRSQNLAAGKSDICEYRIIAKNKEVHWVRDYGYPIWDKTENRVVRIYGAAQDITKRKMAEEALRESQEKYRDLVENINDVIYIVNKEGNVTYISPVLERSKSGFTVNEILGTHFSEHIHPEDLDKATRVVESIMSGNIESIEYRSITKSGEVIWLRDSIRPIKKDGDVVGFQGVLRDITESKKAEQDVYNIFNLSTDLLCVIDLKTDRLVQINPSFKTVLGYESSEFLSRPYTEFIHPNDIQKTEANLRGEIKDAQNLHYFENRVKDKDGRYIWFGWSYTSIFEEGMVYGVGRDINEQKEKEKELLKRLMNYKIDDGNIYWAMETEPNKSIEAFKDLLDVGYEGIIFSRSPEREFEQYIEKEFDFVWLAESENENAIQPDLEQIEEKLNKLPKNQVVMIDRLDYLISKNDFDKTLSFVQKIRELSYLKDLIVIFSIDPVTLSEKEGALLEKECQDLEPLHETMLSSELHDILKYIYKRKLENVSPSYDNLIKELEISRPTARKRVISLINLGYLVEKKKGREKVFEFTDKGRAIFR